MLTEIEDTYQCIRHMDAMCESILRYTMAACLSGPCDDFNNFVKAIKGDVDSGIGPHARITFPQFVLAARNKYLNMVASKEYNKVDVRKQELLALTTKIAGLEVQLRQNTAEQRSSPSSPGHTKVHTSRLEASINTTTLQTNLNKITLVSLLGRKNRSHAKADQQTRKSSLFFLLLT